MFTQAFSHQEALKSAYFEDLVTIFFAIVSVSVPVYFLVRMPISRNIHNVSKTLTSVIGGVVWFVFANLDSDKRSALSKVFGFPATSSGLMDWLAIPALIRCSDGTGCDPFQRVGGYGYGFKLFFFLSQDKIANIFGSLSFGFLCFAILHFSEKILNVNLGFAIILSPSFIFSLERGNSDLFVASFIFLLLMYTRANKYRDSIFALYLVTLKPFFFAYVFRLRDDSNLKYFLLPPALLLYIASMRFDLNLIRESRIATLYYPSTQFGVDQIPNFFLHFYEGFRTKKIIEWNESPIYLASLMFGLIALVIVWLIFRIQINLLLNSYLSDREENETATIKIFTAIFLIAYLSGSQVSYKTWFAFPILAFILSIKNVDTKKHTPAYFLGAISLLATLGMNIWWVRNTGAFFLAIVGLCVIFHKSKKIAH
jgi:hypothetical protein